MIIIWLLFRPLASVGACVCACSQSVCLRCLFFLVVVRFLAYLRAKNVDTSQLQLSVYKEHKDPSKNEKKNKKAPTHR